VNSCPRGVVLVNFMRLCFVAFCAVAIGVVPLALAGEASSSSAVLTVSTTADAVNGDVSSPAALLAHPGPDGISLREAIMAADKAGGREAITFARSLAGRTITPATWLPAFTHDGTALIGLTTADGQPTVTLDGGKMARCCSLIGVFASAVTISHLRIVNMRNEDIAIEVAAGRPDGELNIHDVRVESNVLSNSGGFGVGVNIGTDFPGHLDRSSNPKTVYPGAMNATVSGVTVAHNVIEGFTDDGVNVALPCTHCSISGLLIEDNTFSNDTGMGSPALELGTNYSGNTIAGTRILRNSFVGNWAGIHLNGGVGGTNKSDGSTIPGTGNTISGTVISQNTFDGNQQGIAFNGGAAQSATGNTVLNTDISNDVFALNTPFGAIGIEGGGGGASGNRIDGVAIVNDTIAFNDGAIGVNINSDGASGNTITNISVTNTIFWTNGKDLTGRDVATVLPTTRSSLMGVDPRFVSAQDLHLQSGSAAINTGSTAGAPATDFDNGKRDNQPDVGAYEFGATARPLLDVLIDNAGGAGTVTSSPAGITCGTTCEATFDAHTAVTLTAAPASGSRFAGWSGACSGTGPCQMTLDADATATAIFSPPAVKPTSTPKVAPKCKKGQKSTKKKPCRN
jgi:hypothetical protein